MRQKVLITGILGFIGRHLARSLFSKSRKNTDTYYDVVGVDNLSHPRAQFNMYQTRMGNYSFYPCDTTDIAALQRIFSIFSPDIIIHLAESTPENHLANNIGLQNIINLSKKAKLIYISDSLYENTKASERNDLCVSDFYSLTKDFAERQIIQQCDSYEILRPCRLFGHWQQVEEMIPRTVASILKCEPVSVSMNSDEWMYIDDMISAIHFAMGLDRSFVLNVSSGYEMTELEMANKIFSLMKKDLNISMTNSAKHKSIDCSRIQSLGWKPESKFSESIEYAVSWYIASQWWLK